jgi:hypothetical protein
MDRFTRSCALTFAFLVTVMIGDLTHAGNGAQVVQSEFSGEVENCGIEPVQVEGISRSIVRLEFQEDSEHINFKTVVKGRGVGLISGTTYEFNDLFETANVNTLPGGTFIYNLVVNTHLISHGGFPNSIFRIVGHFTGTPDEEIQVGRFELFGECDPNFP